MLKGGGQPRADSCLPIYLTPGMSPQLVDSHALVPDPQQK